MAAEATAADHMELDKQEVHSSCLHQHWDQSMEGAAGAVLQCCNRRHSCMACLARQLVGDMPVGMPEVEGMVGATNMRGSEQVVLRQLLSQ